MNDFKVFNADILINFASATYFKVLPKPLIQCDILSAFGKYDGQDRQSKLGRFGWTFFDYADMTFNTSNVGILTMIDFIISSNFNYGNFANRFKVI